jgi:small subunit ribosomal protein S24e
LVDVFHPSDAKVTNEQIREYVRTHFKKPHVSLFGVKKYFGGGRTKGFCLIYDNEDSMKKFEPTYRARRVELEKLAPKDRKKKEGKKEGRKVQKVKKHQGQKKRGTKRRQDKNLARKQNKKKK